MILAGDSPLAFGGMATMRVLIILIAVVVLLAFVGWISFSRGPDRSSINVESQEIKEDTQEMLEAGNRAIDRARESIDGSDVDEDDQAGEEDVDARGSDPPTPVSAPVGRP